jgi:hypothetical protein
MAVGNRPRWLRDTHPSAKVGTNLVGIVCLQTQATEFFTFHDKWTFSLKGAQINLAGNQNLFYQSALVSFMQYGLLMADADTQAACRSVIWIRPRPELWFVFHKISLCAQNKGGKGHVGRSWRELNFIPRRSLNLKESGAKHLQTVSQVRCTLSVFHREMNRIFLGRKLLYRTTMISVRRLAVSMISNELFSSREELCFHVHRKVSFFCN